MIVSPRAALSLVALTGVVALASVQPASAACRVSVTFRNPYLSSVVVDLKQSKVQVAVNTAFTRWGTKRKLGTGTLRVKSTSKRRKAFDLPLGSCSATRRYTWKMTYRGDSYKKVLRVPDSQGEDGTRPTVEFARFKGMGPRPHVRTPILTPPQSPLLLSRPLFTWPQTVRARNGRFVWRVTQSVAGSTQQVAAGTTKRTRVRIPALPDWIYVFDIWQEDGAGYASDTVSEEFTIGPLGSQPRR